MAFWEKMKSRVKEWKEEKVDKGESKRAFLDFKKTIRDTLTDIASLEVNSVLVSNISATHPSSDWELLHETCEDLKTWFEKNKTDKVVQRPLENTSIEFLKNFVKSLSQTNSPAKATMHFTPMSTSAWSTKVIT